MNPIMTVAAMVTLYKMEPKLTRVYDEKLQSESADLNAYLNCEVTRVHNHDGITVLSVEGAAEPSVNPDAVAVFAPANNLPQVVTLKAFSGMVIGEFPVLNETEKTLMIVTKKGTLVFDKETKAQINSTDPKFANTIEF